MREYDNDQQYYFWIQNQPIQLENDQILGID